MMVLIKPTNIRLFRDIHEEEKAFIVCNGPSLNNHDLSKLEKEITFGCNRIYLHDSFIPTYYVIEDMQDVNQFSTEINKFECKIKFVPSFYNTIRGDGVIPVRFGRYKKDSITEFDFVDKKISHFYWGGTVTYLMLQLAYYMGCNPIYIIGADHYWGDVSDKVGIVKSTKDDEYHFSKEYYGHNKIWNLPNIDVINNSYKYAKEVSEKMNFSIYNATIGGHLEIFERVNYDKLFSDR